MPNEFARNIQDALLNPATFLLPNGANSTQSAWVDLGADTYKSENVELNLAVPALNATMIPDTRTILYLIEMSANASTVNGTILSDLYTGTGGTGAPAVEKRVRLPSNASRYVRAKITQGSTTGDSSSLSATFSLRF